MKINLKMAYIYPTLSVITVNANILIKKPKLADYLKNTQL
jgi:hypothetical protein